VLVPEAGQSAPAARAGCQVHFVERAADMIDGGGWRSRGGVLSVLSLLDTGVFTEEKAEAVRSALGA
jgi:hypothetical protein